MTRARAAVFVVAAIGVTTVSLAQVSPGPLSRPHETLEGNTRCLDCHASRSEGMDSRCLDCHRGIDSLRAEGRGLHARTGETECSRCHPEHAGPDFELIEWPGGSAAAFDHARTGWPLHGKHARAECRSCHRSDLRRDPAARLARNQDGDRSWIGLSPACADCHDDRHQGALGADCARCHSHESWNPAPGFDHASTRYPLSGRHRDVVCVKCHQPEATELPVYSPLPHAECSDCHADPHESRLGSDCSRCHTPESFRDVPRTLFDHSRTRYPLQGRHRTVECATCHVEAESRRSRPRFERCSSCHDDPHGGTAILAGSRPDCATCHTLAGFRPARLDIAAHSPRSFPLRGRHASVACAECHRRDESLAATELHGKAQIVMRPAHARCADCHSDPHGGQLAARPDGGECGACHDERGWKPSLFDRTRHATTDFPLEGAHARAACAECHGPMRVRLGPLPGSVRAGRAGVGLKGIERECASCHYDPHPGRTTGSCRRCHDTSRFAPSLVDADEHASSEFPLRGAHRVTPCVACHRAFAGPRGAGTSVPLDDPRRACHECHEDPHDGQFAAEAVQHCDRCHSEDSFRPAVRFDHDRDASFSLAGAHSRLACSACHPVRTGAESREVVIYKGVPVSCRACHGPGKSQSGESS